MEYRSNPFSLGQLRLGYTPHVDIRELSILNNRSSQMRYTGLQKRMLYYLTSKMHSDGYEATETRLA